MIGKRVVSGVICVSMMISMSSLFSGCSLKEFFDPQRKDNDVTPVAVTPADNTPDVTPVSDGVLTNGEWLAMVNDAFGMQVDESAEDGELDAARDWGVIGEDEDVDVNAPVDEQFVTATLMRASGFANLDSTDEEIIQAAIDHGVITSADNASVLASPVQAATALATAQNSWSHQEFDDYYNIELAENVVEFSDTLSTMDYQITNEDVIVPSDYAESLIEDTVFILPKDENGNGGAYKTVAVLNNGDGTSSVKCIPATAEEVYGRIQVSGKYGIDESQTESLRDDVEVIIGVSENPTDTSAGIQPLGMNTGNTGVQPLKSVSVSPISYKMDLGDGYSVTATLKDVALNADIDWSFGLFKGLDVQKIYMAVDYTTEISFETKDFKLDSEAYSVDDLLTKKFLSEPSIQVGKMGVYICPGISVNLRVNLTLEASGKIKVTVTTENTKGFEVKNSKFRAINETSTSEEIVITGQAGVYMTLTLALSLDYLVGEVDLVSIDLKVGPTLEAEVTIHNAEGTENDMLCIDAKGYLTIVVRLNFMKTAMDLLGIDSTVTLVDLSGDSSPVKFHAHLENLKRTAGDVCTYEEQETEAETEAETIPVGIFALEKSYISLNVGSSATIAIKSLPTGYSASDIVWQSSDPSKVSVDANGNVTANAAGSVGITATTSDGKYTVSCAVNAKAELLMSAVMFSRNMGMAA